MAGSYTFGPRHAAPLRKARRRMDVILHLGAHRTASTSFQYYMRRNADVLRVGGIGFWGPRDTRGGLLTGAVPQPGVMSAARQLDRARGRVALRLEGAARSDLRQLVISEENMIGAPRHNLRARQLYPDAGQRMARYGAVFSGHITRIVLCIRAQDRYWMSALAYGVARGARLPEQADLDRIAGDRRGWRDVITDLACAMPDVPIMVMTHESLASRPEAKLALMTDATDLPLRHAREWLNCAPDGGVLRALVAERGGNPGRIAAGEGRWQPFDRVQRAAMAEAYADDLFWLRAGADGLARLTDETRPDRTGSTPAAGQRKARGQGHDIEERRLA